MPQLFPLIDFFFLFLVFFAAAEVNNVPDEVEGPLPYIIQITLKVYSKANTVPLRGRTFGWGDVIKKYHTQQ